MEVDEEWEACLENAEGEAVVAFGCDEAEDV